MIIERERRGGHFYGVGQCRRGESENAEGSAAHRLANQGTQCEQYPCDCEKRRRYVSRSIPSEQLGLAVAATKGVEGVTEVS